MKRRITNASNTDFMVDLEALDNYLKNNVDIDPYNISNIVEEFNFNWTDDRDDWDNIILEHKTSDNSAVLSNDYSSVTELAANTHKRSIATASNEEEVYDLSPSHIADALLDLSEQLIDTQIRDLEFAGNLIIQYVDRDRTPHPEHTTTKDYLNLLAALDEALDSIKNNNLEAELKYVVRSIISMYKTLKTIRPQSATTDVYNTEKFYDYQQDYGFEARKAKAKAEARVKKNRYLK